MSEHEVSIEDLKAANPFTDIEPVEVEVPDIEPDIEVAEEVVEEVETEVEVVEETPETDELSPAEKSNLGRKLAAERREREQLSARIDGLIEGMSRQGPVDTAPPERRDPDETITVGEMDAEFDRRESLRKAEEKAILAARIKYADDYAAIAEDVLEDNPNKDKIIALFTSSDGKYDGIHHGDAQRDFDINLANAERDILRSENKALSKELAGKNKKVREESPDGGGVGGGSTEEPDPVQLKSVSDPKAKDYLAWIEKTSGKKAAKDLKEKHYKKE